MLPTLFLLACSDPPPPPAATPEPVPAVAPPRVEAEAPPEVVEDRGPVIRAIEIRPASPAATNDLTVEVQADDPDGDRVEIERQWLVDGEPVPGQTGRTLPQRRFRKGSRIQVEVKASDGTLTTLGRSAEITIRNSAPVITNRTRDLSRVDGYRVLATDADGDPITFRLENAPPSLTIDPQQGVLRWKGSETEAAGTWRVSIRAEDPDGAWADWTFGLGVEAGSRAPAAAEAAPAAKTPARPTPTPAPVEEEPPPRGAAPVEGYQPPSRW